MARPIPWQAAWGLLPIFLLPTLLCSAADGDQPAFTFHSNRDEVRLSFSVLDQKLHPVITLRANDFVVVDKEVVVRNFQSFTRTDWTKVDIAILVDASGSVTPRFRQEIASVLQFLASSGVPDQNLSLFSFDDGKPALLCAGCSAARALDHLPMTAAGLTPLYDTIRMASKHLAEHGDPNTEKVLIVFSDGDDTISRASLADAIDSAARSEIKIYGIDLGRSLASNGAAVLYRLAGETGGRYFPARSGVRRTLDALLDDFQASYTVSYRLPTHDPGFHSIQVLPTNNVNLRFRSRGGYYFPNEMP
jgi:VWFA-related protein